MKLISLLAFFVALSGCNNALTDVSTLSNAINVSNHGNVRASRAFSGPTQFPPDGFAGYGVLAFPSHPNQDPERFELFCRAFLGSLVQFEQLSASGIPLSAQMVTVLPVSTDDIANDLERAAPRLACTTAREEYGLLAALDAIKKAEAATDRTDGIEELNGRGPFLLAWSPGDTFGSEEALVLVADLSNSSSSEQIRSDMQRWRRDIQSNPSQWRRGWNTEAIRLLAQRWVDRRGAAIIKVIGDWS